MYETRFFRAPDREAALKDVKAALQNAGIDPYAVALLTDDEGNDAFNAAFVSVHPAGTWYKVEPTYDEEGNQTDPGEIGGHCLINFRSDNEDLLSVADSFETTDPNLAPSEVPDEDKAPNGTCRIGPPATPIRPIATTE
jgi:hypothetical protein